MRAPNHAYLHRRLPGCRRHAESRAGGVANVEMRKWPRQIDEAAGLLLPVPAKRPRFGAPRGLEPEKYPPLRSTATRMPRLRLRLTEKDIRQFDGRAREYLSWGDRVKLPQHPDPDV